MLGRVKMYRRVGLRAKIFTALATVVFSFGLMGGCINPFAGPTIGEAKVEGRVLYQDRLTGMRMPLSDCRVEVQNSLESAYTDSNGVYSFAIRFRVGSLAKSASAILLYTHDAVPGTEKSATIVIKDGFTTTVKTISFDYLN